MKFVPSVPQAILQRKVPGFEVCDMTNEEALRLIKAHGGQSMVLWSVALNEIVAVHPLRVEGALVPPASWAMDQGCVGRIIDATTATLELLHARQREHEQFAISRAERARLFQRWHDGPVEDLLEVLESGVFPAVTKRDDAMGFILQNLYYARAASLSQHHIERLNAIVAQRPFGRLGRTILERLECWLAVIERDQQRLLRYWDRLSAKISPSFHHADLVGAAGDLQIDRRDVLEYLVGRVRHNGLFPMRLEAVVALGKIGAAAGETAAATIEAHIYDSDEVIAALRRLTIARIRTAATAWTPCEACVKGKALDPTFSLPIFLRCPECFGLSVLPLDPADRPNPNHELWR